MNSEDTKRKSAVGRFVTGSSIFLGCFILGFLPGVAANLKYGPGNILLYINQDGKVSLAPQKGDTIRFAAFDDAAGKYVTVNYTASVKPCGPLPSGAPASTCVYDPVAGGPNSYLFGCTSATGTPCYDPQFGPQCVGCGQGAAILPFSLLVRVAFHDFLGLFGLLPQVPSGALGGNSARRTPEVQAKSGTSGGTPAPQPPPPPRLQEFVAKCNSGMPALYPSGSLNPITTSTTNPMTAEPGDTITWNPYDNYIIAGLNSGSQNICANGNPSSPNNLSCTINSGTSNDVPYQYSLNMSCGTSNSTPEYLLIESPTVPASTPKK